MKKAAKKNGSTIAGDELDQFLEVQAAKSQFVGATFNLGWRLAITVLVPVIVGAKLDDHFHSGSSYTLAALFIAVAGACVVVWQTIQSVGVKQKTKLESKKHAK